MKKLVLSLTVVCLSACNTFGNAPQPVILPQGSVATGTPIIYTVTPIIINAATTTQESIQIPFTATIIPTAEITLTPSPSAGSNEAIMADILGCNTSLDILNSMGEVTNAYVTIKNTGARLLYNVCGYLRAIDEGRIHPDKQACIEELPAGYQTTLKLTVDSTYQESTMIQVDITSSDSLLLRVDTLSCSDINIFGGAPEDTGIIQPIP